MNKLIVAPLQERGVDGTERLETSSSEPSSKCDCMLLRDAHIEGAIGAEALLKDSDASATRHCGRDSHNLLITLTLSHQLIAKDFCQRGRLRLLRHVFRLLRNIELWHHSVQLVASLLRRFVAIALLRLDVQEHGLLQKATFMIVADVLQNLNQCFHVVTIDRADVVKSQLFKQLALASRAASLEGHSLYKVAGVLVELGRRFRQLVRKERLRGILRKLSCALEG
mmetsp:Transcript_85463/g.204821  ORF Transcript_85463/g.204821 Transcript_85463/m.204821 type:complete len:225 (-) Transcript_85463:1142-1816(-)